MALCPVAWAVGLRHQFPLAFVELDDDAAGGARAPGAGGALGVWGLGHVFVWVLVEGAGAGGALAGAIAVGRLEVVDAVRADQLPGAHDGIAQRQPELRRARLGLA